LTQYFRSKVADADTNISGSDYKMLNPLQSKQPRRRLLGGGGDQPWGPTRELDGRGAVSCEETGQGWRMLGGDGEPAGWEEAGQGRCVGCG